jgi:hypothetical protein
MAIDPWGIEDRFHDAFGVERTIGEETRQEVLRAMRVDPSAPAIPTAAPLLVVRSGERAAVGRARR